MRGNSGGFRSFSQRVTKFEHIIRPFNRRDNLQRMAILKFAKLNLRLLKNLNEKLSFRIWKKWKRRLWM